MKLWQKLAAAVTVPVLGGAAYLGVALSSGPASVNLPYTVPDGKQITSACTGTTPNYIVHAGASHITYYPGTTRFTVNSTSTPGREWNDPYINAGWNGGSWSGKCGGSPAVPVQVGKQGSPVASIDTTTATPPSYYFYGNTGYDLWFTSSPRETSYADMSGAPSPYPVATEIMVWTSNTNLAINTTDVKYYPVIIDGRHWYIRVGLASRGHGRGRGTPKGYNTIDFVAPNNSTGNVVMNNLALSPFVSYAVTHGWIPASYWWEGVNAGMEITEGNATLNAFSLTGMK